MSEFFHRIADDFDVKPLRDRLVNTPGLFGKYPYRGWGDSPHKSMTDIWVHYHDIEPYLARGSLTGLSDEQEGVWYPVASQMPEVFPVVIKLMACVAAKRLGMVLVTKLPPGGRIEPHVDGGWHAQNYDKYFIPLLNRPGATFNFPDGAIAPKEGEAYWFRNDIPHWVENNSDSERIAMIVCVEPKDRFANEYRHKPLQGATGDL